MQLFLQREMELGTAYQDALNNWAHGSPTRSDADVGTLGALSSSSRASTEKKDLSPGSADQTSAVKTEYDNQATALETLTDKTVTAYQKQTAAFQSYMDQITTLRTDKYPVLEILDFIHWATFEETAKVAQQQVLDNMVDLVNFAGENVITQYVVIEGADGPNWTPPSFSSLPKMQLGTVDFTTVGASVQAIVAKGLGDGTSGSKAAEAAVQKVEITIKDQTTGGIKADNAKIKTTSRGLAGVTGIGGQL
jgi:hypothetical protein